MQQLILTDDSVIEVETTVRTHKRRVSWHDIKADYEVDDWHTEPPWEDCDGFEHEFEPEHWSDHDDKQMSYSFVCRDNRDRGYIVVSDEQVREWIGPRHGCSKQVYAERVAREKRRTVEMLVKWYENGWNYYVAVADYGDYHESLSGIDCEDYAQEMAETELRRQVAHQMEKDGYIITDKPPEKRYSRVDAMRDRIKRQLGAA